MGEVSIGLWMISTAYSMVSVPRTANFMKTLIFLNLWIVHKTFQATALLVTLGYPVNIISFTKNQIFQRNPSFCPENLPMRCTSGKYTAYTPSYWDAVAATGNFVVSFVRSSCNIPYWGRCIHARAKWNSSEKIVCLISVVRTAYSELLIPPRDNARPSNHGNCDLFWNKIPRFAPRHLHRREQQTLKELKCYCTKY